MLREMEKRVVESPASGISIDIERVTARPQRSAFVQFPWDIYRGDPHWVPPLLRERKDFINPRKHPFYRHGHAVQFLARCRGRVLGRIQVSDDPHYNAQHGTNLGSFGLFECVNDPRVAARLLDVAADWLLARGRNHILGPIDYSTNYSCGLLIQGFDTPPRVMMNHNPPYYVALLESWGLAKAKDMYCWWFDDTLDMAKRWRRKAERLASRDGVTVRSLVRHDFHAELKRVKAVYNQAWTNNWGFVKLSDHEVMHFARFLAELARPELLLLAEVHGTPAGICLSLPDANEALRPLDGRLTTWGLPLGYLRFRAQLKRVKVCRLFTLGVIQPYRRRGLLELMILRTIENVKKTVGFAGAELGWTLEDNHAINHTIEAVGGVRYKTYRIYEKALV